MKKNLRKIWTGNNKGCFLSRILLVLLCSWFMSGCVSIVPKRVEDTATVFQPDKAYVVINQNLQEGRLQRYGLAVFSSGKHLGTKGVVLRDSKIDGIGVTKPVYDEITPVNSVSEGAYTVWEIPEKQIASGGVYGLAFVKNLEWLSEKDNERKYIFGSAVANIYPGYQVSPYECMQGIHSIDKDNIRFMRGAGTDPFIFKKMKKMNSPEQFLGAAFMIDKPGIYYLGDMNLQLKKSDDFYDGRIEKYRKIKSFLDNLNKFESEDIDGSNSKSDSKGNSSGIWVNHTGLARYLKRSGYSGSDIYDLTSSWQDIFIREYPVYFDDPAQMEAVSFVKATPANRIALNNDIDTAQLLVQLMADMGEWATVAHKLDMPADAWRSPVTDLDRKSTVPKLKALARSSGKDPEFIAVYDTLLEMDSPREISIRAMEIFKGKMEDIEMLMGKSEFTPDDSALLNKLHKECSALIMLCEDLTVKYIKE